MCKRKLQILINMIVVLNYGWSILIETFLLKTIIACESIDEIRLFLFLFLILERWIEILILFFI